jgi:hypothetical protein
MTQPLEFPAQPQTLDEAKAYLAWIADNALRGFVDNRQAVAATRALDSWMRAEGYASQITALTKQVKALQKTAK